VKRKALALTVALLSVGSCGKSDSQDNPLKDVSAIVVLQRQARMGGVGDVFQYTSYVAGARLLKVSPPTADGVQTELCCSKYPGFEKIDIQSYDISFDAKSIVFSGNLGGGDNYGLYLLTLNDKGEAAGAPTPIGTSPMHDYVYPIFSASDRVIFVANEVVEAGAKQFRDEYERGTTAQLGSISTGGTDEVLGPRNLSHRVSPFMFKSGEVGFTQWDHQGMTNAGHLMKSNPDFTNLREVFGKENTGVTNSYLKATEVEANRVVVIGTSRDRTFQSGKILDVSLGSMQDGVLRVGEAYASVKDLTPQVPGDREPSADTVGRYYDAYPVKGPNDTFGEDLFLLVSWADGAVEEETNGAAQVPPDFGIYLYDSARKTRLPILNAPGIWDVLPRPLMAREAPTQIAPSASNMYSSQSLLLGSLNVYDSSLNHFDAGSIVKVRILEGFSVEEGFPDMFGLTEEEGSNLIAEIPVQADGSWAALVNPNIPINLQAVDKYDLSLRNEPVWISGRPGEARLCGGCHEDRAKTTVIQPGQVLALANTPPMFNLARADRVNMDFGSVRTSGGVPWSTQLQAIFDAKCISCHEGTKGPANKTLTFVENIPGAVPVEFTFNLKGDPANIMVGTESLSGYSASHLSLLGPSTLRLEEKNITVTGDYPTYVQPKSARDSLLIQKINPPAVWPDYNPGDRFVSGQTPHPEDVGGTALTRAEYRLLVLMADMGGQFYSRENKPAGN
jgi:Hydrazine synthase alpha subunit middle domain